VLTICEPMAKPDGLEPAAFGPSGQQAYHDRHEPCSRTANLLHPSAAAAPKFVSEPFIRFAVVAELVDALA
jgi:hypothetical protein